MNYAEYKILCESLFNNEMGILARTQVYDTVLATLRAAGHESMLTDREAADFIDWLRKGYSMESWYYFDSKELGLWDRFPDLMETRQDLAATQEQYKRCIKRLVETPVLPETPNEA